MSAKIPPNSRILLGKQPARILIVDMKSQLCNGLNMAVILPETLDNFFSVACNIGGSSRLPLFGIMVLWTYPEILLPLSHVKSNYCRIESAIEDLKSALRSDRSSSETSESVSHAIEEACGQFRRQVQQSSLQIRGFLQQLEIVYMTSKPCKQIQQQLEAALENTDTSNLKRINLIAFDTNPGLTDFDDIGCSQNSSVSNNSSVSGLVDVLHVELDSLTLQNFFNTWLLDSNTDSEHLHIVLPGREGDEDEVIVKCDLQERVLNPAQLPFYGQYTIQTDSATMKTFPTSGKTVGISIPIHRIRINNLIPIQAICDSVVFGMPMIVHATCCWKLDWDDLEKNQQKFKAICYKLMEREMAMIGQLESFKDLIVTTKVGNRLSSLESTQDQKPLGRFLFLPAPNGTLLVKTIAVQELLLPYNATTTMEDISDDALIDIKASFEKLQVMDNFNPLLWPSGLYECLKRKYGKNDMAQQKHRSNIANPEHASASKQHCPGGTLRLTNTCRYTVNEGRKISRRPSPRSHKGGQFKPMLEFPTDL